MIVFTLLLIASSALAASVRDQKVFYDIEDADQHFEEFIETYGRQYADEEEKQNRLEIFKQTLARINELNSQNEHAVFGITKFSDLSKEELSCFLGVSKQSQTWNSTVIGPDFKPVAAPAEFDWRQRNVVSRVKNQLQCSSCWAFSAIGGLESQYAIKHGQIQEFSEQQLVDCDKQSIGCKGGWMHWGYQSMIDMGGAMSEQEYPYQGVDGQCVFDANKARAKLTSMNMIQTSDEEQLKGILYQGGPIAIVIDANSLFGYTGGVITSCPQENPALHAVLLVGYGVDQASQQPYWLIKNSWDTTFGEQGYFRLGLGSHVCGITQYEMVTPVVA